MSEEQGMSKGWVALGVTRFLIPFLVLRTTDLPLWATVAWRWVAVVAAILFGW
jgi:hypothetical protein